MKKYLIFSLMFLMFTSCNKDIPKDIPDWLKDEIKHCKKKGNCCYEGSSCEFTIYEYTNIEDNSIYYVFKKYCGLSCDEYYDINGTLICQYNPYSCYKILCGDVPTKNLVLKREIWKKSQSKC